MACTCSLKRDHLSKFPEIPPRSLNRSRSNTDSRRPRPSAANSDPSLTVFSNGHHRPARRLNHAERGAPYRIPRPHSIHGHVIGARNSSDNLRIPEDSEQQHMFSSITSVPREERLVRSEHGSPGMSPMQFDPFNQLPQLDLSYAAFNTSMTSSPVADDYGSQSYNNFEPFVPQNDEQAPLSAALSMPPFDWSAMDLPLASGNFSSEYSQPPSYASFEQGFHRPGLTPSSSGEASEADEFIAQNVSSPAVGGGSPYITSPGELGYGYDISNDSPAAVTQPSLIPTTSIETMSIDSLFPAASPAPTDYTDFYNPSVKLDTEAFRPGFSIHDSQKLGQMSGVRSEASVDSSLRTAGPTSDPLWSAAAYGEERSNFGPEALWINQ